MSNQVEKLKAELEALESGKEPAPASAPTVSETTYDAMLRRALERSLDPVKCAEDEAKYIGTHRKCAVCFRHANAGTVKCSLCGTEGGEWLPVTTANPSYGPHSPEHLSNVHRNYDRSTTDTAHIAWLMNWRRPDQQINAARFIPGEYHLSPDLRAWCRQILIWSGVSIPAEPTTAPAESVYAANDTQPLAEPQAQLSRDVIWAYRDWKVQREADGLPSDIAAFIAK